MKNISFQNFRKFSELKSMPLGEITLLVGGNNAGKSTIGKAVRLVVNNLKTLQEKPVDTSARGIPTPIFRFDGEGLNIGDFGSALHYGAEREEMVFTTTVGNQTITFVVSEEAKEAVYGVVDMIEITDHVEGVCIELNVKEHKARLLNVGESREKEDLRKQIEERKEMLQRTSAQHEELGKRMNQQQAHQVAPDEFNRNLVEMTRLGDEVQKLQRIIREHEKLLSEYEQRGGEVVVEKPLFSDDSINTDNLLVRYLSYFARSVYPAQRQLSTEEKKRLAQSEAEETEDRVDMPAAAKLIEAVTTRLVQTTEALCYEYVAAHEAAQKSFYYAEASDSVSKVVCEFMKHIILPGHKEYEFIENWMRRLGIGETLRIDSMKGEAFRVWIVEANGHKADLSELGKGAIQVITMLLRLATIMRMYRGKQTTIIIEEPEQNMHPNWQSWLADLFYEINKDKDYRFKFIVETHSEYLVRKTQVLVANEHYQDQTDVDENCPFKVYYLPNNNEPYDMKYQANGTFSEEFGEGFYGEASSLSFKVLISARK